jgi:hypothetical protein
MSRFPTLALLFLFVVSNAIASTPVEILGVNHPSAPFSSEQVTNDIRAHFDVDSFRLVRAQAIYQQSGAPDHWLIYLFSKKYHRMDFAMATLDGQYRIQSVAKNYRLRPMDITQQPGGRATDATCPDTTTQFISFAENDDSLEQSTTAEVTQAAQAKNLKTVTLLISQATRQNYLNYMSCPALEGNFYDGDANPQALATADGMVSSDDISTVLKGKFKYWVTNIWVACEAYNDPMLSAVQNDAQAKKYAAGINDLEVGPSDKAAACAMEAALANNPMTGAFNDCVQKDDTADDHWGWGGNGSDLFSWNPQGRR